MPTKTTATMCYHGGIGGMTTVTTKTTMTTKHNMMTAKTTWRRRRQQRQQRQCHHPHQHPVFFAHLVCHGCATFQRGMKTAATASSSSPLNYVHVNTLPPQQFCPHCHEPNVGSIADFTQRRDDSKCIDLLAFLSRWMRWRRTTMTVG